MKGQNKKITLAVTAFYGGGAERVMVTLANKLVALNYPVDLIVAKDDGPYREMLDERVSKIVLLRNEKFFLTKIFLGFLRAYKYFRSNSGAQVMSTIREFNMLIYLAYAFSGSKGRIVLREADTLDRLLNDLSLRNRVFIYLMRKVYHKADHIVANCEITKSDLVEQLGLSPARISVIYNPLSLDKISSSASHLNDFYIVACGRLTYKKNFGDLIKVFPLLLERYPELNLLVLGVGEEENTLKEQAFQLGISKHISFVGFVKNPYSYFKGAKVFVQTSLWEGFGYVLAEAMACGTPLVAYDGKGAMREILEDGKYGKLVPIGSLELLAKAIIMQIESPMPSELLLEGAARFDADKITAKYISVITAWA